LMAWLIAEMTKECAQPTTTFRVREHTAAENAGGLKTSGADEPAAQAPHQTGHAMGGSPSFGVPPA
jgi:hypothetical protein